MARRYPHPIIAREGWPFLAHRGCGGAAGDLARGVVVGCRSGCSRCSSCSSSATRRATCPPDPRAVLSPADGRVVEVSRAQDPYVKREALKVSVFMNVFNVHSNRSPVDGTVQGALVLPRRVRQRRARQGFARQRAQRALAAHARGPRRHLRAGRRADRAAHPVLRGRGRAARARPALRLHPLRLARRPLPAARRRGQGGARRQGIRLGDRARMAQDARRRSRSRRLDDVRAGHGRACAAAASTCCPISSPPACCSAASSPSCRR